MSSLLSSMGSMASSAGSAIGSGLESAGSSALSGLESAGSAIGSGLESAGSAALNGLESAGSAIGSGLESVGSAAGDAASWVGNQAKSFGDWISDGNNWRGTMFKKDTIEPPSTSTSATSKPFDAYAFKAYLLFNQKRRQDLEKARRFEIANELLQSGLNQMRGRY